MSVLFRTTTIADVVRQGRPGWLGRYGRPVTRSAAFTHSAFWAAIRLRADLISTLPIDVYRKFGGIQIAVPTPPVLVSPSGSEIDITEWLYSSQVDLDSVGNSFGLITERDGSGLPRRIDLVPRECVIVQSRDGRIQYSIDGVTYKDEKAADVWHERQFTNSGMAVGLSPLAAAALSISQYTSAQEFAVAWYQGAGIPPAMLKHTTQGKIDQADSDVIKDRYRLAIENGDLFVVGKDWDFKVIEAEKSQATFIETMDITDVAIARYTGVPGDVIDAPAKGSSVTYANISQRNLQLLIMHLGPAIIRRERTLSRKLLPAPRFVKFNTDALLRLDPETVSKTLGQQVKDRLIAPSEARELLNRAPFTPEQLAEFEQLFPTRTPTPATTGA